MNSNKLVEYLLQKEAQRYAESKEWAKTLRHLGIALIAAIVICACFYMYFVVPVEEVEYSANNGSQIIDTSNIQGDNINGL